MRAIGSRRSIGRLGGDVTNAELHVLVAAAMRAPNHRRTKPWRFTAIRGEARRIIGERWADLACAPSDAAERRANEAAKLLRAPLLLVISTRTDDDPITALEDFAACAAATQNVLLAAHGLGLGTIWRTGAMAYDPGMLEILGLAKTDRIVAIVYVGKGEGDAEEVAPQEAEIRSALTIWDGSEP